jgi:hypothetical protein
LHLSRDARFAESLHQTVNVALIAEGKPSNMLGKRVFRIDLNKLAPDPACLLGFAQMTEHDGEKGAREVSFRGERMRSLNSAAAASKLPATR